MFKNLEKYYKKESPNIKINRCFAVIYFMTLVLWWLLYIFNLTLLIIPIVVVLVFVVKCICENILNMSFKFVFFSKNSTMYTVDDAIRDEEYKLIKKFLINNNYYSCQNITNLIEHYRFLTIPPEKGNNLFNIISLMVSISLPFLDANGFNLDLFGKVLPYIISCIVVLIIFYCSYKTIFQVKLYLSGDEGMFQRLEVLLSEILVEFNNVPQTTKKFHNKLECDTFDLIGNFTLLWNLFEKNFFDENFRVEKVYGFVDKIVHGNRIDLHKVEKIYSKLKMYNDYRSNISLVDAYCFRNEITPESLNNKYTSELIEDKIYVFVLMIYRVRNNLFHGIKEVGDLNNQKILFECINNFLSELIVNYNIVN